MKLWPIVVLAAGCAFGQGEADRDAIQKSFSSGLVFTADGLRDWERYRPVLPEPQRPMSEVTAPTWKLERIRFLSSDLALAEAAIVQFGSIIVSTRVPMLLIFRRIGMEWRVDVVRSG